MRRRVAKAAVQSALTVGILEFFGEFYSLVKRFWPIFEGFWWALEQGRVLFLVINHQHFTVSTGIIIYMPSDLFRSQ